MKKDNIRDYATEAFRFYAINNYNADKYKNKIYCEALEYQQKKEGISGISKPTESVIIYAENAIQQKLSEIYDMEAVEDVVKILESENKDKLKALKIVYLRPEKIERGDIQKRVIKAENEIPAGQNTVYRYLREARYIFAELRGLRRN